MIKVNRKFKNLFGTQDKLDSKIKEELKPDKNGNVSVDDLRDFVLKTIEHDMIHRKITKKDVEGFLSAFNYSTYGDTNIDQIAPLIFTADYEVEKKLAKRVRANPPPDQIATNLQAIVVSKDDIHNNKIRDLLVEIEDKVFNGKTQQYGIFK